MKKIGASLILLSAPLFAFAQFGEINTFIDKVSTFINGTLIPLLFAIALLVFLYGVFKFFILGGGDQDKRDEGKQLMLYAIIGFVVMVSIWGIVNLIAGGLGFSSNDTIQNIPDVPTGND